MAKRTKSPAAFWEYHQVTIGYGEAPDYTALGGEGWELVTVYESGVPPSPLGKPFEGRTFVFKRPKEG